MADLTSVWMDALHTAYHVVLCIIAGMWLARWYFRRRFLQGVHKYLRSCGQAATRGVKSMDTAVDAVTRMKGDRFVHGNGAAVTVEDVVVLRAPADVEATQRLLGTYNRSEVVVKLKVRMDPPAKVFETSFVLSK